MSVVKGYMYGFFRELFSADGIFINIINCCRKIILAFKQFDRIEVRQDDGKFWAEFLVLSADKNSAYVKELTWYDLSGEESKGKSAEFVYKWRGPYALHGIIRAKDGSVMVDKLPTRVAAEKWLTDYLEKI